MTVIVTQPYLFLIIPIQQVKRSISSPGSPVHPPPQQQAATVTVSMPTITTSFPLAIHRLPHMSQQQQQVAHQQQQQLQNQQQQLQNQQLATGGSPGSVITSSKGFVMPQAITTNVSNGYGTPQQVTSTENGGKMIVKLEGNGIGTCYILLILNPFPD